MFVDKIINKIYLKFYDKELILLFYFFFLLKLYKLKTQQNKNLKNKLNPFQLNLNNKIQKRIKKSKYTQQKKFQILT